MTKVTHLTLDETGGLSRRRIHLREISGDADAPLETVGQDLRAARLRRGDDLATVSKSLKIRKDHLEALEEDRLEALPGRTYAVGFIRSYSDYLGLDPVQCVERFKAEIAGRGDAPMTAPMPDEADERRLPHGWIIIAVVVLAVVSYGAYRLAISADALLRPPVASVPARLAPKPAMAVQVKPPAAAPQFTIQTPPADTTTDNGAAALAPDTTLPASGNPVTAPPAPAPGAATANAEPEQTPAAPPPGTAYGEQNHNARVILRVKETTRIVVVGPGGSPVYINRVLKPGDSYQVPDLVGLTLAAQHGNGVEIELDGQPMGMASHGPQATETLSLDPQDIADRYSKGQSG
jgi:cytoskeleton protein RodZ